MERKGETDATANADFDRDMAIARQIMDKRVTLALALGDDLPDINVATLLTMAEQQREQKGAAVPSRE